LGLFIVLIGLVIWDGADRRAADATRPLSKSSVVSIKLTPPRTLKIGSFNIHSCKGADGIRNLSRTAELLCDIDFAGLYEVRATTNANQPNQAAALADLCKVAWLFAPTEKQWWSDHFGNGLMYRIPVNAIVRIPLVNTRGKAYRNAILSTADIEGGSVRIIAVHIDREDDRRSQLQSVIDLFLSLQEPCVLMGDLNTPATDPLLVGLRDQFGVRSPLHEFVAEGPLTANIDWIFTRGLKTISAALVENTASDHPFLKAELAPMDE
jgi:endonuclease/exonuclease/phosphatase family metal-dependent hydrolase